MINILLKHCIDLDIKNQFCAMIDFILEKRDPLKDLLSKKNFIVQTWERDPWIDYGKSDELYSCTSLGDYNAANAPGFFADLNINNLDIWSHGTKVGRIHLCIINDISNNPMLLLDCVDGTERMLTSKRKYQLIMSSVLEYSRYLNIRALKINCDVDYNTTPKKFIKYVESEFDNSNRIDFISRFLLINTTKQLMPYPCQTFLESFLKSNGAFVKGPLIII